VEEDYTLNYILLSLYSHSFANFITNWY